MRRKILVVSAIAVMVLTFIVSPAKAATQAEIDQAIQWGLAWLATQQNPSSGYFGSGSYILANTATAVLAFENEGHFPGGGNTYSGNVEKGLDYIFTRAYKIGISNQWAGNPDTNGNGLGVYFRHRSYMYETGLVMQAVVASNTPNRIVTTGPCTGMTYRQVMEDLVDFLAWAQIDGGPGRGGWRYGYYSNTSTYADNSVAQWPVLGLVAAEQWGIYAPQFVKDEMEYWVTYIQNANGGSGYHVPSSLVNISKTGGLLVEFFYLGDDQSAPRAQRALNYVNTRWNVVPNGWYGNKGHPYAMFSVFKGLELMQVPTIPNAPANSETPAGDWWGDYSEYLVITQSQPIAGQGYWNGYSSWGRYLATPWYIIILQASVFPVSVDVVVPGSACDDTGYDVSVHYSVERFLASGTLTVYKDSAVYDTITLTDFRGSGTANYNVPTDTVNLHTWKAVLDVTGGGISVQTEDTDDVDVYDTPLVTDIPDQFMPFTPFDLDNYQICDCADVDWSATGVPSGWTVTIDADNMVTVTAPEGASAPATITFVATFHWPGIDCTDNDTATFYPNRPPVAHPGKIYPTEWYTCDEGGSVQLDGTQSYDPDDGDTLTYAWDLDENATFETTGDIVSFSAVGLNSPETDEVYVYLKVCDNHGACDIGQAEVEILDLAPTAAFSWSPEPSSEGSPVEFTDESTSEVDDIVAWTWDFAGLGSSNEQNPSFTFPDNGTYNVCLTVTDDDDSTNQVCQTVTVSNVPPTVDAITVPLDPVNINEQSLETVDVTFSDPAGVNDEPYTCDFDLENDGVIDAMVQVNDTSCSTPLNYAEPGVYTVMVTVTDKDGGSGSATATDFIVIYDPDGGFVTGGGWIDSPEGAYVADPYLTGKATFGFVSKYKKKELVPTGNTEFQFHAGDLNFHSNTYYWLVIAGPKAMYKGTGTINGAGNYGFMIFAIDEKLHPVWEVDRFRIQIWDIDSDDALVYDNDVGADEYADPATEIQGGNIVLHKK